MKRKRVKQVVKATIKWEDGTVSTTSAKDYIDLFNHLEAEEIVEIEARTISLDELRQGKDTGRRMQHG